MKNCTHQPRPYNPGGHETKQDGFVPVSKKHETPDALAGATGGNGNTYWKVVIPYCRPGASAMPRYAKDAHNCVCRRLGFALTLDDPAYWTCLAAILYHRLTSRELTSLAFATLSALEPKDREVVFAAAQWGVS